MNGQQMLKRDFVGDLTPREGRTRRATALAAQKAVKSPVTLVTLGAASLDCARLSAGAPLVAVPVIFGVLFLARLRSGRTWAERRRTPRTGPIELPDLIWYSDGARRRRSAASDRRGATLANAVAHSPQDPEHEVAGPTRSVADMERRIVLLASRVEYLGRFLSEISLPEMEAEAQRVRTKEANARSAEARARYQLGVAQREAQMRGRAARWRRGAISCWPPLTTCWRPWRRCPSS